MYALLFLSTFEVHVYLTIATDVSFVVAETTVQKRVDIWQGSQHSKKVLLRQLQRVSGRMDKQVHIIDVCVMFWYMCNGCEIL